MAYLATSYEEREHNYRKKKRSYWLITSLSHIFDTLLPMLTMNVE